MKAMLLDRVTDLSLNKYPLRLAEIPTPVPKAGEVLIRTSVCGISDTELDEIEGRLPPAFFPIVPGHQVVGEVVELGSDVRRLKTGDRVGVAWIFSACGRCAHCLNGEENLCAAFQVTGQDVNGGYAEYISVPEAFTFRIPPVFKDAEAAPLLFAGATGYRSLRLSQVQNGQVLGLAGFGATAHLVLKMAKYLYPSTRVFVLTNNDQEQRVALEYGAAWAGNLQDTLPQKPDAIIDTSPFWKPVSELLRHLGSGGRLVINAIRKENPDNGGRHRAMPLSYRSRPQKIVRSVTNMLRRDVQEFLQLAATIPLRPEYEEYPLEAANKALLELKTGQNRGAIVLVPPFGA